MHAAQQDLWHDGQLLLPPPFPHTQRYLAAGQWLTDKGFYHTIVGGLYKAQAFEWCGPIPRIAGDVRIQ